MMKFLSYTPKAKFVLERHQDYYSLLYGEKSKKDMIRLMLWLGFTYSEHDNIKSNIFFQHIILSELPEYFHLYGNCYYLLATLVLPTPTRTILHYILVSDTWEVFSKKLFYNGNNMSEKILGQQVIQIGQRKSDVGYLLYFLEKLGIVRPGRNKLFLPKKFHRTENSSFACTGIFTRNPYKIFLLDSYLYGSQSISPYTKIDYRDTGLEEEWIKNSTKYISMWFTKTTIDFITFIKKRLPTIIEKIKTIYETPPLE